MTKGSRLLRAAGLVVLALTAVMALAAQSGPRPEPAIPLTELSPDTAQAGGCEQALELETVDLQGQAEELLDADLDLAQPASICRLAPECSTNSDCDAICGAGQGRCGHSRCPIRVCKCG
jgi:hypothetical protein